MDGFSDPVHEILDLYTQVKFSGSVLKSEILTTSTNSRSRNSLEYIWPTEISKALKANILIDGTTGPVNEISDLIYPTGFSKNGIISSILYEDSSSYKLNNKTNTILSLKSVMKLMLMMTNYSF